MRGTYTLYGWQLSLYSGKARAYLRYKGIPFVEQPIRLWHFGTIRKKVGARVMPVVVTPEGEWLQDTSYIMDRLEERFPEPGVVPATPRQRVAAYVLEAWGDEYWLPTAMHYRWNFPENQPLFRHEGGRDTLPFAPRFVRDRLIAPAMSLMRSFLPGLGVNATQAPIIEQWTEGMCDLLDAHFAQHPYLLGTRPCYGDFGLIGPLYAHLGRDPYPKRTLIAPRKHLAAWVARMQAPEHPRGGAFLPGDEIPVTLAPILRAVFREFWPFLDGTLAEVQRALPQLAPGRGFRRWLGEVEFPMGAHTFRRNATPFSLWMAQRALDAYASLRDDEKPGVDAWLATVGGERALQRPIRPRLKRIGLHVAPE